MPVKTDAEFDYEICSSRMMPIAEGLINKYDELHHIDPDKILFVVNHKSAGSRKQMVLAKTTAAMDENQMVALVYRELRRISPEGEILSPDVIDWWQMLMGLGRKWYYPDNSCPNLLDDNVDWKKLMGTYFEEPSNHDDFD